MKRPVPESLAPIGDLAQVCEPSPAGALIKSAVMSEISPLAFTFHRDPPSLLVVDRFYQDPDGVRRFALAQEYEADLRYFKGERTKRKFLFPWVKEEFERRLGCKIIDWLDQPANGSFQKTTGEDPIVWHSDTQSYAAAIYLTLDATEDHGTSFWRHRDLGARRPSPHHAINAELYSEYNLLHPDNWQLVDRVGSVYNRLVIWDAQLIHSATSYEGFTRDNPRLVQLFFFSVAR